MNDQNPGNDAGNLDVFNELTAASQVPATTKEINAQLALDEAEQTPTNIGSQPAPDDYIEPSLTPDQMEASERQVKTLTTVMGDKGIVSQGTVALEEQISTASRANPDAPVPTLTERADNLTQLAQSEGKDIEPNDGDPADTGSLKLSKFVSDAEGYSATTYDDRRGKGNAWTRGVSKGDPTVGFGWNLNRADSREQLARYGLDYDKVLRGEQRVPLAVARELRDFVIKESQAFVRKTFKGAGLADHQIQALTSLTYNSKWNKSGPTLLGPNIRKAILAGDWRAVAFEIAWRSEKIHPDLKAGIHTRRIKEAILFLGPEAAATTDFLKPGYKPRK